MRKLMWFTLGFGAACALSVYWGIHPLVSGLILLLGTAAFIGGKWWKPARCAGIVAMGALAAMVVFSCYYAVYLKPVSEADGTTVYLEAEATDYSYETTYGSAVEARIRFNGFSYRVVVYVNERIEILPGDVVKGEFRLRSTNGGVDEPTYHRGKGIMLLCYPQSGIVVNQTDGVPLKYFAAQLRRRLCVALDRAFSSDTAGFAKALLLGDRSDVSYDLSTDFKVAGISHIIAVSGLHVSIVMAVVTLLCGRRRMLMALLGFPTLLLFAAVTGFTPSVTRACLMQMLMLLGLLCNKEYDPLTSLSFAALTMLLVNPLVITSVSFQLSVGCMAGIFLFSKPITDWINGFPFWKDWKGKQFRARFRNWISGGVGVTLSAMFFTTPLVAYYFGTVSLVGVLTNLLTLWAVSACFYGIMVVSLLSFFWSWGAWALAWCVSIVIRYVVFVVDILAAFPLAAVYTKSIFIVMWLILCYGLLAVFLMAKRRQPVVLICSIAGSLCVALLLSSMEPMLDDTRMTVLDVGQGQCVILQSNGRTFLVDCGGDRDEDAADLAAETLLSQGVSRLDGIIVTHYDRDHSGGVGYLLQRIPADAVFLPNSPDEDGILETILPYCNDKAVFVDEDLLLGWGDSNLTIFAPILSTSDNERGLCVLFRDENCDILITGDLSALGEQLLLKDKHIPKLTALVVGHHGSKNSTGEALLEATMPQYAMISVGKDNYYGHPHDFVLQRLERIGCVVHRTDLHGTILFRR